MVELKDDGNGAEALLEISNLLKRVTELNHGRLVEHPVRVHDELAVLQAVEIRGDQEEVGCRLNLCEVNVYICQQTIDEQVGSTSRDDLRARSVNGAH